MIFIKIIFFGFVNNRNIHEFHQVYSKDVLNEKNIKDKRRCLRTKQKLI